MMKIFRTVLKKGMKIVDIGANLGYFTVIAARRVGPSGRIFSYEPDPHNYALLKKNIETNHFKNVIPVPVALSDKTLNQLSLFKHKQHSQEYHLGLSDFYKQKTQNAERHD